MPTTTQYLVSTAIVSFLFIAGYGQAAHYNFAAGEKLYKTACKSCHGDKPAKMAGKPTEELTKKMKRYKDMARPTGNALQMQQAVKPLSTKQIQDIGAYLRVM